MLTTPKLSKCRCWHSYFSCGIWQLQNEITFIQEHDAFTDATLGGTRELCENNDILDEVAKGPLPQDDATAAELETQETEAAMDSAIQWYLKSVRESIQNKIKQHMRPDCYIWGDFFHRKRHAVFALCDDSATGFMLSRQEASTADRPNKDGPCCLRQWLTRQAKGRCKATRMASPVVRAHQRDQTISSWGWASRNLFYLP